MGKLKTTFSYDCSATNRTIAPVAYYVRLYSFTYFSTLFYRDKKVKRKDYE